MTSRLQHCCSKDDIIKVNTKSMPVDKDINSNLLDLTKDLDNASLRKNDENDEI